MPHNAMDMLCKHPSLGLLAFAQSLQPCSQDHRQRQQTEQMALLDVVSMLRLPTCNGAVCMMLYLIQVLFGLLQGGISLAVSLLQALAVCVCMLLHL